MPLEIRTEIPQDSAAIYRVNALAFDRNLESDLVNSLRQSGEVFLSMVAVDHDAVVGHVLFSPVHLEENPQGVLAVGLGPVAVCPDHQGQLIGTHLIRAALDEANERGAGLAFVLGDPQFYSRFGFAASAPHGFSCQYPVPPELFQVLELQAGTLVTASGRVKYASAFDTF